MVSLKPILTAPASFESKYSARTARSLASTDGAEYFDSSTSSPLLLTEGESSQIVQKTKIDYLTFTFKPDFGDEVHQSHLFGLISPCFSNLFADVCIPKYGYEHAIQLFLPLFQGKHAIGRIDYGGEKMRGRARIDLSGTGCSQVRNYEQLHEIMQSLNELTITRVDLAFDAVNGEYDVDDAVQWYREGLFNAGGRMPRHSTPGDWIDDDHPFGRTLEIGRKTNGKMMRIYEKGRQLGDTKSQWVRFELQLSNKDRTIPLDVLVDHDKYFCGAYKCLADMIPVAPEKVKTDQLEKTITIEKLTSHARTSYGKLVNVLRLTMNADDVIAKLSQDGVPNRLERGLVFDYLKSLTLKEKDHVDLH